MSAVCCYCLGRSECDCTYTCAWCGAVSVGAPNDHADCREELAKAAASVGVIAS